MPVLRQHHPAAVDCWLIFVRESSINGDPVLPLLYDHDLTWQSVLLWSRTGERIAIVGRGDADTAQRVGLFDTVIGYDQAIRPHLLDVLERLEPQQIALNFSENDVVADGLSVGLLRLLERYLAGTPFAGRFVSAERIVGALRGRKSAGEVARIRAAIATTLEIYQQTFDWVQPGRTEREVSDWMHARLAERGLGSAWDFDACPIVNAGPDGALGHAAPSDRVVQRGQLLHLDFGVRQDEYCSDIQRVMYFLAEGEMEPPLPVRRGFATVVRAIQEAAAAMKPGVPGKEIDRIAREIVIGGGIPGVPVCHGAPSGARRARWRGHSWPGVGALRRDPAPAHRGGPRLHPRAGADG